MLRFKDRLIEETFIRERLVVAREADNTLNSVVYWAFVLFIFRERVLLGNVLVYVYKYFERI